MIQHQEHLIVDFPSVEEQVRCRSNKKRPSFLRADANKILPPEALKDRVHFAEECQLKLYEKCDPSDKSIIWYNNRDYKAMRVYTKTSAKEMQKQFLNHRKQPGDSNFFDNAALTGIECLLSPNLTRQNRKDVWDSVMTEQDRQDNANECDPEKLASAVFKHTRLAAGRARTIGLLQAK